MPKEFFETAPMGMTPAAAMMWVGFAAMLFFTMATVLAYASSRE